jgi:hypothetical protein
LFNGTPLSVTPEGAFNAAITLDEGVNEINVSAADAAGNTTVVTRSVRYTAMDHFDVHISAETIITAGEPFTATIIARYADDTIFPYTGVVRLDDTSGLLLPPQVQMTGGQWTDPLTLYAAQPVTITASARNRSGEGFVAQVLPGDFHHVAVWPGLVTLIPGQSRQFTAGAYDAYNNVLTGNTTINWSVVNGGGSIDAVTGEFIAAEQVGVYTHTVKAELSLDAQMKEGYATVVIKSLESNIYLPLILKSE